MIQTLSSIFASYIITCVLCKSSVFEYFRTFVKHYTPQLRIGNHPHFIECRLCVGFWVSIIVCLAYNSIYNLPLIYGASYFLATQER